MLTFGSLFTGIGGIDLGLERAGMRVIWQCEIDDYATRVLEKHWPNIPRFRDVRDVGAHNLPRVDVLAGGFPCQDISTAGSMRGIDGARSGLWREFARVIRAVRPRYALVENVANLLYGANGAWFGRVLGDLAESGYDAEWQCLSAAALGAPHRRERVFVVAYPTGKRRSIFSIGRSIYLSPQSQMDRFVWNGRDVRESGIERVANRTPLRMERLRGLGNTVVPQVAEFVGRCILEHERTNEVAS